MSKKVISFFTFGFFLLFTGLISKFFNWSQSNIIMATGLLFELLAALIFISEKLRKK
ncbi:hypothetical protein [Lutibacter sp.]